MSSRRGSTRSSLHRRVARVLARCDGGGLQTVVSGSAWLRSRVTLIDFRFQAMHDTAGALLLVSPRSRMDPTRTLWARPPSRVAVFAVAV